MAARPQPAWFPSAPASAWAWPPACAAWVRARAVGSAVEALARNPGTRPGIMLLLVLGLAFIESLTLFTMVIIFVKM